jgi:hypothetical protein
VGNVTRSPIALCASWTNDPTCRFGRYGADGLQRALGYRERDGLFFQNDSGRDEPPRPPGAIGNRHFRDDPRRPGFLVEQGAHKDDVGLALPINASRGDIDPLPFMDGGEIAGANGELDPNTIEIDDDEQLSFTVGAAKRRAEIDLALDDTLANRGHDVVLPKGRFRLCREGGDLRFIEP